jgi:hypothetical protein
LLFLNRTLSLDLAHLREGALTYLRGTQPLALGFVLEATNGSLANILGFLATCQLGCILAPAFCQCSLDAGPLRGQSGLFCGFCCGTTLAGSVQPACLRFAQAHAGFRRAAGGFREGKGFRFRLGDRLRAKSFGLFGFQAKAFRFLRSLETWVSRAERYALDGLHVLVALPGQLGEALLGTECEAGQRFDPRAGPRYCTLKGLSFYLRDPRSEAFAFRLLLGRIGIGGATFGKVYLFDFLGDKAKTGCLSSGLSGGQPGFFLQLIELTLGRVQPRSLRFLSQVLECQRAGLFFPEAAANIPRGGQPERLFPFFLAFGGLQGFPLPLQFGQGPLRLGLAGRSLRLQACLGFPGGFCFRFGLKSAASFRFTASEVFRLGLQACSDGPTLFFKTKLGLGFPLAPGHAGGGTPLGEFAFPRTDPLVAFQTFLLLFPEGLLTLPRRFRGLLGFPSGLFGCRCDSFRLEATAPCELSFLMVQGPRAKPRGDLGRLFGLRPYRLVRTFQLGRDIRRSASR